MVTEPADKTALGEWIVVECPARADLSGGWSDTPPITYEHGGAVFNVALTIDGKVKLSSFMIIYIFLFIWDVNNAWYCQTKRRCSSL